MKRRLLRILLALLILIVIAVIVAQVVLSSDYPRTLVLRLVQQQLGLRVEAKSLETGWFGATTLRDVKVSLPLADESFLSMPTMEVDHTALIPLLVTRKFELDGIELDKPNLVVRRDANGRWNLQDVAELVTKATAGTPAPGTKKKPPKLPRLRLRDGTVTIIERNGAKAVIEPLQVTGDPHGPLVYKYDAQVPDRLKAIGQVAPGENFKHEVELFAAPPGEWLTPWMKEPPAPLVAKARWNGEVSGGHVVGRLNIEEAKFDKLAASGRVALQAGGAGGAGGAQAIINPQNLIIKTAHAALPEAQLASGAVEVTGSTVRAKALRVSALGGTAQLDGSGDISMKSGEFTAQWLELPAPGQIRHAGDLKVTVRTPFPGGPQVAATLNTRGSLPKVQWDGQVQLNGSGRSWTDMTWVLRAARVAVDAKQPVLVENFTARVAHRGNTVTLSNVEWPGHQVAAEGQYDGAAKRWYFRASGRALPRAAAAATAQTPIAFNADARGDDKEITLTRLALSAQELDVALNGKYVYHVPKPVDVHFKVTHAPRPPAGTDEPPLRGSLFADGHVTGTADPLKLNTAGTLYTRDLVVLGRPYGDISGKLSGDVTATAAKFAVGELKILGGQIQAEAVWPYDGPDRLVDETGPVRAIVVAQDVKLKDVGDLLKTPLAGGDARGQWTIDIPFPGARPETIALAGTFSASNIVVGEAGGAEKMRVDEITGETSLKNGVFRADPIRLRRADGDVSGVATVSLQTTVADPARPTLVVEAKTWPVRVSPTAMAAVTAGTNLAVNAKERSATGPITARAIVTTTQRAIGEAELSGRVDGRVVALDRLALDAIGGRAEGSGAIDANDPNRSTLTMSFSGIAGARVADFLPQLEGLAGTYAGSVTLAPATAQRALEPLRLTIGITPDGGRFNAMEIGPAKFSAFLNVRENFSLDRIVLAAATDEIRAEQQRERQFEENRVPLAQRPLAWNDIRVADGRIRLWGRHGSHTGGALQTHVIADFQKLDIDQIIHAVKPQADPMPGRLGGSITVHGNSRERDLMLGRGRVEITESDLANVDALAVLYNATRLGSASTQPLGSGSLDISLHASKLTLQNIRYFNRGVEARSSSIEIADVWQIPRSHVFGYIAGSGRPLKDLKLPFLADVDQIMGVLQQNLPTVKLDGPLEHGGNAKPVLFGEAGDALRRFIVGEVNSETRGK